MQAILDRFAEIVADPYPRLRDWKARTGRKVLGCLPMYVPEEIIHAAGALPVVISGGVDNTSLADAHMPTFACSLVRSSLEAVLRRDLDFCDGFVFPYICDSMQSLSELWPRPFQNGLKHHILLPARLDTAVARTYLLKELQRFKEALETLVDADITAVAISKSIDIYNGDRDLLQHLYDLRRRRPGLLTGRQVHSIVRAAMLMPKEEHAELLHGLLLALGEREAACRGKVRLVLSGILATNLGLLDMLEEAGGVIVDDDLYNGSRYFAGLGDRASDPMEYLANRFFNMIPCSTKHNPSRGWAEYIVQMAQKSQADGVIVLLMKYCDPHAFDYPGIKNRLEVAGIPQLLIETDLDGRLLGQVQTRLQAFFELVRGV